MRVLIVDDDAEARQVLTVVLEHAGAMVTAASSAYEALDVLHNTRPDVLVSDVGMPGQDGLEVIRQVRASGHAADALPAVALTAFVQRADAERALAAGFQIHVPKPANPYHVSTVIAGLVARAG